MGDEEINKAVYQDFALRTYASVRTFMESYLRTNREGTPLLVVVGEQHLDIELEQQANESIPDELQEPALAAAFSEIGALEAAARLVGRDDIALSIELPPESLPKYVTAIRENGGIVPDPYKELPFMHTLAFAVNNNIEIVPTDPGLEHRKTNEDLREEMQKTAISAIASADDPPRIIVHVGGQNHISNLSGYLNREIRANEGDVLRDDRPNPFAGVFDNVLFFNATRNAEQYIDSLGLSPNSTAIAESRYAENPANAIQIDAPGRMSEAVANNIGEMVRQAATDYNESMKAAAEEGATPDNNLIMAKM